MRLAVAAVMLALFSAGVWFAWCGWDRDLYYDDGGFAKGPYHAWQVVACAVSVGLATAVAHRLAPPQHRHASLLILPAAASIGFAISWAIDAASNDDSGIWVIDLVPLLWIGGFGLGIMLALIDLLPSRKQQVVA